MAKTKLDEIKLYNRKTCNLENEEIFEKALMNFFYSTNTGDLLSRKVLSRRLLTWIYGIYQETGFSKKSIQKFVSNYSFNLDEMELPLDKYKNFNEFFTRKLRNGARNITMDKNSFISPSDSKLIVYQIKSDMIIPVKGTEYTLTDLLQNPTLAKEYENGICMVFRLAPLDYHRYCYIDNGNHRDIIDIEGLYYSVHPYALAKNYPIFTKNHRQYTVLETENFGNVVYMEVGATFVGTICQNNPRGSKFEKGEEKGYFKFGGSTVVLLTKPGAVQIDNDILNYSKDGIETIVKYGEKIGEKII